MLLQYPKTTCFFFQPKVKSMIELNFHSNESKSLNLLIPNRQPQYTTQIRFNQILLQLMKFIESNPSASLPQFPSYFPLWIAMITDEFTLSLLTRLFLQKVGRDPIFTKLDLMILTFSCTQIHAFFPFLEKNFQADCLFKDLIHFRY